MARPANKARGEIAVPELGGGIFLRFTFDSLQRLESQLGDDYFQKVLDGLADNRPSIMSLCVEVAAEPQFADEDAVKAAMMKITNVEAFKSKVYDAFFLMNYGMTYEEKKAEETARLAKEMANLEENPHLAALLLSGQPAPSGTEPASSPKSSAA